MILPCDDLETSKQQLKVYWSRFRQQYGDHEIFDMLSEDQLELTIPCKLHGDEGRRCLDWFLNKLAHWLFLCDIFWGVAGHVAFGFDGWVPKTRSGKRKSPIMLLQWQPVLGRGTSKTATQPLEEQLESQRLNMLHVQKSAFLCLYISRLMSHWALHGLQ